MSERTRKRRAARAPKTKTPRFEDVKIKKQDIPNILEMVPSRNPEFSYQILTEATVKPKLKVGCVAISILRFKGRLGQGFCRVTGLSQHFNLNLDDYGTLVWLSMDGKRTVREIGVILKERFGEKVEPLYWRLAYFLSLLERNRLVLYKPAANVRPS